MKNHLKIFARLLTLSLLLVGLAVSALFAADVTSLAGTSWRVAGINRGKQAVQSVILDTELTVHFGADGRLYGLAGCNNYTTAYEITSNTLRIEPAASTRKMCNPPEVMDQESAFLKALAAVNGWRMAGGQLDLLNADGSIALTMVAMDKEENKERKTFRFRSRDGGALIEMHNPEELSMSIGGQTYEMKQVVSASGAKYEAVDDPTTVFWNKGNDAFITVKGKDYPIFREVTDEQRSGKQTTLLYRSDRGDAMIDREDPQSDEITMTFDGQTYRMKQVISASGAKYEAIGDPTTVFWSKGDEAYITIKNKEYPTFRQIKSEPRDEELFVTIDGETFRMKRVASASGARYESVDDPTTHFWSKGRDATLTIRGQEYSKYVLLRNSPWEDELLLTVDGENFRLQRVEAASGTRYEAVGDPTTVFWSKGDTATLTVRGKEYVGYDANTPLPAVHEEREAAAVLPLDVEWTVQQIGGHEIVAGSTVTMTFHSDGALNGRGSVNGYMSRYLLAGDKLLIRGVASTMMAGPQELMDQEGRFLQALERINKFQMRDGKLILMTRDGEEIVAVR